MVVVTGRDRGCNAAVAAELTDADAAVHEVDVRDEAAVERTVAGIVARLGRLDILVNNAGMVDDGPTTDISREDWEAVIATDLTGPFSLPTHAPHRRPLLRALHGPPRHNAPEGVRLLMIRADGTFMV